MAAGDTSGETRTLSALRLVHSVSSDSSGRGASLGGDGSARGYRVVTSGGGAVVKRFTSDSGVGKEVLLPCAFVVRRQSRVAKFLPAKEMHSALVQSATIPVDIRLGPVHHLEADTSQYHILASRGQ
ncbi:unnamed protein product [Pleuronectes platessa]|uniref:Uncharacterized protein n=1 Tax=Pleuronectes platessa TaxID=8262 RepID=A0A9N7VHI7_PLEPL|nr:unnamed protein product [Pleuronectes platessa]